MAETSEPKLTIQNFHQCASLISTKLTNTNYLLWKSQVLPLIKSLGLEHHIIEDAVIPSKLIKEDDDKEVVNPEFVSWTNIDGLLMAWLMGMMTEDVVSMAIGGNTSRQVWLAVEEQILPATKEKESWLKDSLYSMKKGSLLLEDFLKRFKCICDSLAAIGRPISDEDKMFQIARALGPKYADFKTAMLAKPPLPSFNQFILAFQGHEQTIIAQIEEEKLHIDHHQAFFSQRGRGRNQRGNRFGSRGRGFQQNNGGRQNSSQNQRNFYNNQHYLNFQKQNVENQKQENQIEPVICQICGKKNHIAKDCWDRYDYVEDSTTQALAAMNIEDQ